MKFLLIGVCMVLVFIIGIGIGKTYFQQLSPGSPLEKVVDTVVPRPLEKYTFENLRKKSFAPSVISLGDVVKDEKEFISYKFYFLVDGKKVSGLMNTPKTGGMYPVLILLRGFVPKEIYTTGEGSRRTGEYFAQNGFITLAPDFLGFGESEKGADDGMEDRFQTYTTGLTLLTSIKNLNTTLQATRSGALQADTQRVGLWGHSNGGHIALSLLSITQKPYPTVLWNPVSKMFPYSILYFTDEYDDHGKALRKFVANFENIYDIEKFSPPNYYKYITAPIQLHQAEADEEVPLRWSNELYDILQDLHKDVTYYTYPEENHNFNKGSWPQAVQRSAQFFQTAFQK
jgi:dipeptidyl aminopeptidase/acylaminoacyl peptidase